MARLASAAIRKTVASTGARNAMPPMSCSRGDPPARAATTATIRKSATVTTPWLTICSSAPCAPRASREKIPSVMKPSWATDEYPRIRRTFVVVNAMIDP